MKTITFIIPYYGNFPNYFNLWLESAQANESIDFYIITDNQSILEMSVTHNIKLIHMTLDQIRKRTKSLWGGCRLERPYKLCDYRPFYGILFPEYISGYDFWGYCDIDVIWGNIRKYITDDVLNSYEKISNWGHLTLYRNTVANNRKCTTPFTGASFSAWEATHLDFNVATDEKSLSAHLSDKGVYKTWINKNIIADIFPDYFYMWTYFNYNSHDRCVFEYNEGKLYGYFSGENISKAEFMYIHLQKREMVVENTNKSHYLIFPSKFVDYSNISKQLIYSANTLGDGERSNVRQDVSVANRIPVPIWILRKIRLLIFKRILKM